MLARLFRKRGWRAKSDRSFAGEQADLVVSRGSPPYGVERKVSSEGRRYSKTLKLLLDRPI
jgi:hypothetical protein